MICAWRRRRRPVQPPPSYRPVYNAATKSWQAEAVTGPYWEQLDPVLRERLFMFWMPEKGESLETLARGVIVANEFGVRLSESPG